jgi:hypothetical protein
MPLCFQPSGPPRLCYENGCAEGTLTAVAAATAPLYIGRMNRGRKAVAAATAVKALRAFSFTVASRRLMGICGERHEGILSQLLCASVPQW